MTDSGGERRIIAALAIGLFCVQLDFFGLSLALPRMADDFHQSTTNLQWVLSAYMITIGAALIPAGRLGDLRGRRRMVIVGLVVFGSASTVCGLAQSLVMLIAFRAVQGLGAATLMSVSVAAISNTVRAERRASAIGILFGLANIGTALGPFVGGLLTEQLSWRWIFLLNVPLVILAIVLCARWLPETRDEAASPRIDIAGLVTVALAVAAVAYAADRGAAWGWTSARTLGTFALGAVLLVTFTQIEKRVRNPLIDLSLLRNRPFVLITTGGTVSNIAYVSTVLAVTVYLQDARGLSPVVAGVVFLAPSVAVAFAGPIAGRLAEWRPVQFLLPVTLLASAVGLLIVSFVDAWGYYVPALGLTGFVLGLGWTLPNIGTQAVVDRRRAGEAAGVNLTAIVTIGGISVALAGTLIEIYGSGTTGAADGARTVIRIVAILAGMTGFALLGNLAAPRLRRTFDHVVRPHPTETAYREALGRPD